MKVDFVSDINKGYGAALNYSAVDRFLVRILWWHLLVVSVLALAASVFRVAAYYPTPFSWRVIGLEEALAAILLASVATLIPTALRGWLRNHYVWRVVVTFALATYSYIIIFVTGGSIEGHFHVFMVMGLLVVYADWRLNWINLVLVAIHHVVLNYVAPQWVYFYGRNDAAVVAHALPVLVTAIFTSVLCENYRMAVVRLRSQVQTEAERDEERRRREELQRNITRFLGTVMEIAQGDLTKRARVTSDVLGSVVDAVNVMVEHLGTIIGDVRRAALRVASRSNEMIGAASQMAVGAQTQADEAGSVSTAVEELTYSIRRVSENAEASAAAAQQGLGAAQRGDQAVRDSLEGMERIRAEVQAIAKKIRGLGERSLEITEIVHTIEDIVSQTNILAVNAAIEAAGAGEAGIRFAVVAEEVRKLAERSAKATRDIASVIKGVQAETQEAIAVTEHGASEVEAGYRVTVQAGKSLGEIAEIAARCAELSRDISLATQQQVRGAENVAAAVQSIADVAVQSEQAVARGRKTAEELTIVAEELTGSISRFKLAA